MPIRFHCPACDAAIQVKEALAGKQGRCPRCKEAVRVPDGAPTPSAPAEPAPAAAAGKAGPAALMQQLLGAFRGDFPRVRRTFMYRFSGLLVAAMMLLLPVLYVGLIGLVGYFLYWHATANTEVLHHVGAVWGVIFLYAGPLVVGAILLFFMLKPLFARPSAVQNSRVLPLGQEPLLHAFVARVARAVHAPEPKRIEVDWEVNASAGFAGGFGSLFGHNLVLTIGLPLAAGLNVQQLAAVLAHELGHFAQGGGMRLSYIIRSINGWFARAVFQRDGWDETLAEWCEEGGRASLIFLVAVLCIGLTRAVLWLFLMVAHAISCLMERHMEYDADRYAARLIGSAGYEEASRRIMTLTVGGQAAWGVLIQSLHKGSLPDDLPALIVAGAEVVAKKQRRLDKALRGERTALFDTHPAFPDRMASVRREKAPGIFQFDRPATELFSDYPKLARKVTQDLYEQMFERKARRGGRKRGPRRGDGGAGVGVTRG
jgi:Zn-dependent protease with chaperone function